MVEIAQMKWREGYWTVIHMGIEHARFDRLEETNALDFCNGFNAGLSCVSGIDTRYSEPYLCGDCKKHA